MRPGRPFYCALLLDSELDPNLNCFWPPPRGLQPNQPWTSCLTWKTLLDSIFSKTCTTHGHKHGCHVLIHHRLDDERAVPRFWDVDPVISPEECDRLLRPTQRLRRLGVDKVDLVLVFVVAPSAHVGFEAPDDHVHRPLSLRKGPLGLPSPVEDVED
jgi:hypothetical protein